MKSFKEFLTEAVATTQFGEFSGYLKPKDIEEANKLKLPLRSVEVEISNKKQEVFVSPEYLIWKKLFKGNATIPNVGKQTKIVVSKEGKQVNDVYFVVNQIVSNNEVNITYKSHKNDSGHKFIVKSDGTFKPDK